MRACVYSQPIAFNECIYIHDGVSWWATSRDMRTRELVFSAAFMNVLRLNPIKLLSNTDLTMEDMKIFICRTNGTFTHSLVVVNPLVVDVDASYNSAIPQCQRSLAPFKSISPLSNKH